MQLRVHQLSKRLFAFVVLTFFLVSSAALAWAQFTSTITESASANAGTLTLIVTGYTVVSKPDYVNVEVTGVGTNAITITASPFAPGDSVVIDITIKNMGTLPATSLADGVSYHNTYDAAFSLTVGAFPPSLASGDSATIRHTITLAHELPNEAEGASMTGTVTFTGSVGT
jgi:uncharacterized membrane protein